MKSVYNLQKAVTTTPARKKDIDVSVAKMKKVIIQFSDTIGIIAIMLGGVIAVQKEVRITGFAFIVSGFSLLALYTRHRVATKK